MQDLRLNLQLRSRQICSLSVPRAAQNSAAASEGSKYHNMPHSHHSDELSSRGTVRWLRDSHSAYCCGISSCPLKSSLSTQTFCLSGYPRRDILSQDFRSTVLRYCEFKSSRRSKTDCYCIKKRSAICHKVSAVGASFAKPTHSLFPKKFV